MLLGSRLVRGRRGKLGVRGNTPALGATTVNVRSIIPPGSLVRTEFCAGRDLSARLITAIFFRLPSIPSCLLKGIARRPT